MNKSRNIFKTLTEKPWEKGQIEIDNQHKGQTLYLSKYKLGLRTIMVVSTIIFSLFVVVYSDRMLVHDWRSMPEPWLLWLNTAILVLSSLFFHFTKLASDKNKNEKVKNGLYFIGFLGYSFLIGQLLVWYQFMNLGYYATTNPANAFFYLFTTLHGLHLIGGLYFWGRTTSRFLKADSKIKDIQHSIELCAIYWHFLLAVWVVLFGLMLFT
tara:strand:- start:2743 stop:3375 length:633 start_codon:yes stop_codon:yes gene_type:complete